MKSFILESLFGAGVVKKVLNVEEYIPIDDPEEFVCLGRGINELVNCILDLESSEDVSQMADRWKFLCNAFIPHYNAQSKDYASALVDADAGLPERFETYKLPDRFSNMIIEIGESSGSNADNSDE
jgi:hypothetical protein